MAGFCNNRRFRLLQKPENGEATKDADKRAFLELPYILKKHFVGAVVTGQAVAEGKAFSAAYFGQDGYFNEGMWRRIVEKHGGRLPVRIKAVPEGVAVPTSNVLATIENTDPECFALTNHLETVLSQVWYPSTVATVSRKIKSLLRRFMEETAGREAARAALPYMLHDFGYRGVESVEAAGIGGAAHLVNFLGTDTIAGIQTAMALIPHSARRGSGSGRFSGDGI